MEIKTFVGKKLKYVDGIYRRQIELDRYLKTRSDVKLTYEYYRPPKNPIDFIAKRFILYPIRSHQKTQDTVYHLTFQYLGDLAFYTDSSKTIATCHDVFSFLERDNLKRPYPIQKYALLGLKQCKYLISISDFTKNELVTKLKLPKDKIHVIKNGMNRDIFFKITEEKQRDLEPLFPNFYKILHVGTEVMRKDFLTLLKAFYLVKKRLNNVKLIRIGTPSYMDYIRKFGLENDIIYLKNISNDKLREIYNQCDVFVFPSLYEGWGAPGLEAAACGTPIICSDIPIFREVYANAPIYFPIKNYQELCNKIIEVITDDSKKELMGQKGIEVSKKYSWVESSKKYLELAKKVLEEH